MRDRSDRYQVASAPLAPPSVKRLGSYLVEAGLITPAQVDVALNDQKVMSDLRFGEALVTRGWIKQQTLDYLIKKIVEPEQQLRQQSQRQSPIHDQVAGSSAGEVAGEMARPGPALGLEVAHNHKAANERKSRPSVPPDDDDVGWVG
jgi:hypothetical protein